MSGFQRQLLEAGARAGLYPGCSAGWSHGGSTEIVVESIGYSRIGIDREPVTPGLVYDLASLTKPLVVTTLFLLARRQGLVRLDRSIGRIFPDLGPYGQATMEDLLTHRAGLPGWAPLYAAGRAPEEIRAVIGSLDPVGLPGVKVEYSCLGFILLGKVLEKVLGMSLVEAFEQLVTGPLDLGDELMFRPPIQRSPPAGGANFPEAEAALVKERGGDVLTIPTWKPGLPDDGNARFLGGVAGNSGLFGTARGVVGLARQFLPGGGCLLEEEESDLAARCRTPGLEQHRGLGWQVASSPGCSAGPTISCDAIGHVGFTGTSLWIDRQNLVVMTLLSNRHHPGHRQTNLHPLRRRFNSLTWADCLKP